MTREAEETFGAVRPAPEEGHAGDREEYGRIKSIDRFRGFCVACMLIFQFMNHFPSLGFLQRIASHYPDTGYVILPTMTIADFIAPAFIFAIGLTFALSFKRRQRLFGTRHTVIHFVERALAIVGLGTFMDFSEIFIESFSGTPMKAIDWVLFALSAVMLAGLVLRMLPVKSKKFRNIAEQIFYLSISVLGAVNIVVAFVDYATIQPGKYWYWSVLQGIGFAILIALPFVRTRPWLKLTGALVIGTLYSVYHQIGNHKELLDIMVHGGVVGAFGWAAMLLLDMFVADLYFRKKSVSFAVSAGIASIGVFAIQWLGEVNMGSCSPTFILVGTGLSGVLFMVFDRFDRFRHSAFDPLIWWGKNPLIMFILQFFVIGIYTMVAPDSLIAEAPLWSAALQSAVVIVGLTLFVYRLAKRKKSIRL